MTSLPPDLGKVACFHASDPSWAPAWPSSWPGVPEHLYVAFLASFALGAESKTSTFFIVSNSLRSTFHRRRFARCFHRQLDILLFQTCGITLTFSHDRCPVHLNLKFHISSAFVNLQTFATIRIMLHLLANPCPTLFCVNFRCLPMNREVRTRRTTDCHTILSQVCPRDDAPTWCQRQMDDFRSWGLKSLCSVGSSSSDISTGNREERSNC